MPRNETKKNPALSSTCGTPGLLTCRKPSLHRQKKKPTRVDMSGVDMLVRSNFGTFGYFNSVFNIRLEFVAKLYCRDRLECATSSDVTTAPQNPQCGGPERSRGPLPLRKSNCSTGPYQRRSFNPYPNAQVHNFTKAVAETGGHTVFSAGGGAVAEFGVTSLATSRRPRLLPRWEVGYLACTFSPMAAAQLRVRNHFWIFLTHRSWVTMFPLWYSPVVVGVAFLAQKLLNVPMTSLGDPDLEYTCAWASGVARL